MKRGDEHPMNALRTRQINDLTELFQIVKLTFPVRTYSENIHIILLDIINFLSYIVFNNDLIGIASSFNCFYTLQDIIADIQLSSITIKTVVGDTHN